MSKSVRRSLFIVLTLSFILVSVYYLFVGKKAHAQDLSETLTMDVGASIRIANDGNGIRFAMIMSEEEYETIQGKVVSGDISDVSYGVLIAPAYYVATYPLNETNVFGDNPKYNWSVDGVYTPETGKARITNLSSSKLGEYKYRDGYVGMYASIIDIQDVNIANEFIGIGYMKYTENTTVKYQFATENDNVRSIAYAAQMYINNHPDSDYNETLNSLYLSKVTSVASNYTTEYYLEDENGDFVKSNDETVVTESTIGATATPVKKEILGYYLDSDNVNNSAETVVLANNKTVLKLYYGLAEIEDDGTFYNSDFGVVTKPADSPCNVPAGWTYDGDNSGYNYFATNGELRFNMYDKRVESTKFAFEPNKAISASVDGYVDQGTTSFNLFVYFYDADGELLLTGKYANNNVGITNTSAQTFTTGWFVSPADTAYVSMGIAAGTPNLAYFDNAKLYVEDFDDELNADGTFYNSDFSVATRLSGDPCDIPAGWFYDGDNAGHNYLSTNGKLRFNGYSRRVESMKFAFEPNKAVSASVDGYIDQGKTWFNLFVYFYDADGVLLQTGKYSSDVVGITNTSAETFTTGWFVSPANTAYVSIGIAASTGDLMFVDNAKLNVAVTDVLNSDGTFFNSDFSVVTKPADSPCNVPFCWTYDGDNAGYNYFATNGELRFNGYSKRVESVKFAFEPNKAVSASVDGYIDQGKTWFNLYVYFYDADGVLLQTGKYSSDVVGITNTSAETFTTGWFVSPANTAYVSMGITASTGDLMFVDNAKLNVAVTDVLNSDGTFFNSDFSVVTKPADSPCNVPFCWIYDGDNAGYNYFATNGELRFNGYSKRVESVKFAFEPNKAVSASVDGYIDQGKTWFNLFVYFYDADGVLLQTGKYSSTDVGITNTSTQTFTTGWFVSPANTAYVSMGIAAGTANLMYVDNAKLYVADTYVPNSDGTFYHSDFSEHERKDGFACDTPVGWTFDDSYSNWEIYCPGNFVRLVGSDVKITSVKLQVATGQKLTAQFSAAAYDNGSSSVRLDMILYDANDTVVTSVGQQFAIDSTKQQYSLDEYVVTGDVKYVEIVITQKHNSNLSYVYNPKLVIG